MKAKVIKTGEIVDVYHEPQHGQITNVYYKESVLVNGRIWTENELDFCVKANGAPEKIYLFENPVTETPDDRWLSKRSDDNDIEYTRTDAFIEEACDAYCAICDTKECHGCAECSWVIKFRKQLIKMKGE